MDTTTSNIALRPQFDPVHVEGGLSISLFGLHIARVDLSLNIASLGRLARAVLPTAVEDDSSLQTLSRTQLYELATEAQLRGRSSMSRDDLIAALESDAA